jgi:hypothetical protein
MADTRYSLQLSPSSRLDALIFDLEAGDARAVGILTVRQLVVEDNAQRVDERTSTQTFKAPTRKEAWASLAAWIAEVLR